MEIVLVEAIVPVEMGKVLQFWWKQYRLEYHFYRNYILVSIIIQVYTIKYFGLKTNNGEKYLIYRQYEIRDFREGERRF